MSQYSTAAAISTQLEDAIDGGASPYKFLHFLRRLLADDLSIHSDKPLAQEIYAPLVEGLTQHFLDPFPYGNGLSWQALDEKVSFTYATLQVVERASARVNGLFSGRENLARQTFVKLLDLWCVLGIWRADGVGASGTHGPETLICLVKTAISALLRRCDESEKATIVADEMTINADNVIRNENVMLGPTILQGIIKECLGVHAEIRSTPLTTRLPIGIYFFQSPRFRTDVGQDPFESALTASCVRIVSMMQLHELEVHLIEILACTVPFGSSSTRLLPDISHQAVTASTRTLQFYQSFACSLTSVQRTRLIAQTLTASLPLLAVCTDMNEYHMEVLRILHHRLHEGPRGDAEPLDNAMQAVFSLTQTSPPPQLRVKELSEALFHAKWDENTSTLLALTLSYLRWLAPSMTEEDRRLFLDGFHRRKDLYDSQDLRDILTAKPFQADGSCVPPKFAFGNVINSLQRVVRPEFQPLLLKAESWEGKQWVDMFGRLEMFDIESAESRLVFDAALSAVPCILTHPTSMECIPGQREQGLILPMSKLICSSLLILDSTPNAISIRLDALSCCLRHGGQPVASSHTAVLTGHVFRYLVHTDREIRISAGRAIAAYFEAGLNVEDKKIRDFRLMANYLSHPQSSVREAVLITLGFMGRTTNRWLLGMVVCSLIYELGSTKSLIRSVAYVQLTAIAKKHKKSPYHFISPYFPEVSYHLISHICSNRLLLSETCRFISLSPAAFIKLTSKQTFPRLFAERKIDVLRQIGLELKQKLHSLFLEGELASLILAHVFLLKDSRATTCALDFLMEIVIQGADHAAADINQHQIVKSHLTPLLTELVVAMGDSEISSTRVLAALSKVQALVHGSRDLGIFLESQMLAVIAHINEMLQDIRGRRSSGVKRQIIRSIGPFIQHIGPKIALVSPQIMATLQNSVVVAELVDDTLATWSVFLETLNPEDVQSTVGPTSASLVAAWDIFSQENRNTAQTILKQLITKVPGHLGDLVDLNEIQPLADTARELLMARRAEAPDRQLQRILESSWNDNLTIATQALAELKKFILENQAWIRDAASGDAFHPIVGQIVGSLFHAAGRDSDGTDAIRCHAFECIGLLGAVDPDRFDASTTETRMLVHHNFSDEGESISFALYLISAVLVGAFRSTTDTKYQAQLAFAIQELLQFCKFSQSLISPSASNSVPMKVRKRWYSLSKDTLEIVTPLLASRYSRKDRPQPDLQFPIYSNQATYREWLQHWTLHLISRASGEGKILFNVFQSAVVYKDVGVAYHILPHLVLHVLISGDEETAESIRTEIMVVLEDQVQSSNTTQDKKTLSAQVVFMLMDHLNRWVRYVRQSVQSKRLDSKRVRGPQSSSAIAEQLSRVDSVLSSINQTLVAKAALKCGAYARSLVNFEHQILSIEMALPGNRDPVEATHEYYERLHEIYARLEEPDGMAGVSTRILSPSLEHQIREHESMGRWTAAQSCWEVRLQQSPDELDYHLGLLRCLNNLGHYDTLRTHIKGVLPRNPGWEAHLARFQLEASWTLGDWDDVANLVHRVSNESPNVNLGNVLLAVRSADPHLVASALRAARSDFGARITALSVDGYRRCYDAVLLLHLLHEIEIVYNLMSQTAEDGLANMTSLLTSRFNSVLPTFRTREAILGMRRTAFTLISHKLPSLKSPVNTTWLASARIARKAGYSQTAYSAVLQAQQGGASFAFIQSAKLVKATGEHLRALQELKHSMHQFGLARDTSEAQLLRARWMRESDRHDVKDIMKIFREAAKTSSQWESGQFHHGHYQDECYKQLPEVEKRSQRGAKMIYQTIQCFSKAIQYGSKHVYETVPRFLSLWLDMGEDSHLQDSEIFKQVNEEVQKAIQQAPVYKWFTAFPQIVSRIGLRNSESFILLTMLITTVLQEYPDQGLWLFISVVKSTKSDREQRGRSILHKLKTSVKNRETTIPLLVDHYINITNELLALCDHPVPDGNKRLSIRKDFPKLYAMAEAKLIIPLQESLTTSVPPTSSTSTSHQPFPSDPPRFHDFGDDIEIMRSLAKPRKISVIGSNGQTYIFLGKPKDDLRKDARLMDFNSIINNLLKRNSESRRRKLHIRTYGVVTLNEECGFIQWVPNTTPLRLVLVRNYETKNIKSWSAELTAVFAKMKEVEDTKAAEIWRKDVLPQFPPVFHEWFVETFPEPSAWLASRMTYSRTAAVMSMVGFILGLGDRHLENILLDVNSGDVVHVDFNCLFEKGKQLETPERVPFRLTQNLVDGLGVTGVEGVFRIACEVAMKLLRDNKDCLMNVLEAFIHDPLVEWEEEKRKADRIAQRRQSNNVKQSTDLRKLASNALGAIEKKLRAIYKPYDPKSRGINYKERDAAARELSTSDLVEVLIQDSVKHENLAKMYPGWAAWH